MPNITGNTTGSYGALIDQNLSSSGAISLTRVSTGNITDGSQLRSQINFNASLSNPIYGNAETVQPPTIMLIPQIRY